MDPNFQQFQSAITAGNGTGGDDIYKNYAASQSSVDQSGAGTAGKTASAQANADSIAQANAQAIAAANAQRTQDAADPSKAQMRELPNNGGFAFYDGTGKQININQYSLMTGKTPAQLLANSPNPKDQKFVEDYNTAQALSNAWVNGDTKTLDAMRAADPKKFNQIISTYKTPAAMIQAFTKHWSDYYNPTGTTSNQESPNTSAFAPQQVVDQSTQQKKQQNLAPPTLAQTLTPETIKKPTWGIGGSILSHIPGTSENKATSTYNSEVQANPWYVYNKNLFGG